ncbi:MAG: hypothetical protein U0183_25450 [Polyangiaceae bacterium]
MRYVLYVRPWLVAFALGACGGGRDVCLDHDDEIPKATDARTAAATVDELVLADGTRFARPIAYADANSNVVYVDRTYDTTDAGPDASPPPDGPGAHRIARLVWAVDRLPADVVDVRTEVTSCPTAAQRLESQERCSGDAVPERWTVTATLRRVRRDSYTLTVDHPRLRVRVDVGWIYPCHGY